MTTTTEFIMQMGYYPDALAHKRLPPDIFFTHAEVRGDVDESLAGLIEDCVHALVQACREKYEIPDGVVFPWEDTFWSCVPKPSDA